MSIKKLIKLKLVRQAFQHGSIIMSTSKHVKESSDVTQKDNI